MDAGSSAASNGRGHRFTGPQGHGPRRLLKHEIALRLIQVEGGLDMCVANT